MAKIAGAALIVLSGAALGSAALRGMKSRVRLLEAIITALGEMKSEMEMLLTPMPELLAHLASGGGEAGGFFASVGGRLVELGMAEAWRISVNELPLGEAEKSALSAPAGVLGRFEAPLQCAEIELARQRLEALKKCAEEELRQKGKTSVGLGLSLAAMLAVILM